MDPAPVVAISSSGKWKMEFFNQPNPAICKSKFIKFVPYAIIERVENLILSQWSNWEPQARNLLNGNGISLVNAKQFLSHLCDSQFNYKIENLFSMATRGKCQSLEQYFIPSPSKKEHCLLHEAERHHADIDFSKGFVSDISLKSLKELADRLVDNPKWRRMGDAFGFSLKECLSIKNPLDLLNRWILSRKKENVTKATVCRLHYEAQRVGAKSVCNYLDAIPLEGVAEIDMFPDKTLWKNRFATRFDMKRLDELFSEVGLQINWSTIAQKMVFRIGAHEKSPDDAIWWTGDVIHQLLNYLPSYDIKAKECLEKFQAELQEGSFEAISPGGLSYSKVIFLANVIKKAFESNEKPQEETYRANGLSDFLSLARKYGSNDQDFFTKMISSLPKVIRSGHMNAERFLCIFWQEHQDLDLDAFCQEVESFLPEKIKEIFHSAYLSIKPIREYDPELAVENLKSKTKETANSIAGSIETSQPLKQEIIRKNGVNELCVICIDKEVKVLAAPCGHYAFCIECIKQIQNCSVCNSTIESKIEVFHAGVGL